MYRYLRQSFLVIIWLGLVLVVGKASSVYAMSTVMGFEPGSGTFKSKFSVSLKIDGHGDVFNAAGSNVKVSPNLMVQDLILGDCGFSFTRSPSASDPSFEGVILGSSTKNCTVYAMTLVPVKDGEGSITMSKSTVRRFGDASEVLKTVESAKFDLIAVPNSRELAASEDSLSSANELYAVALTVLSADGSSPLSNQDVVLKSPGREINQSQRTDSSGKASYSNLKPGIYIVSIQSGDSKQQDTVLNLSGANHNYSLTIKLGYGGSILGSTSEKKIQPNQVDRNTIILYLSAGVLLALFFVYVWFRASTTLRNR